MHQKIASDLKLTVFHKPCVKQRLSDWAAFFKNGSVKPPTFFTAVKVVKNVAAKLFSFSTKKF